MSETNLLNNRYRLQELLGKGGMASVFRATDTMLERDVALKILKSDYTKSPAFRERFRQEAKAAANLHHPNIVTVHDFGYDSPRLYIVMEYVKGKDLNSIMKEHVQLKTYTAIKLAIEACKGIGYAHRAGLVHCDIKPHNFLVDVNWRLKVTDFGIARAMASIDSEEESKMVWGSPQYFSPEQATGMPPSPASDVYSLGVVLYLMTTGKLPFTAKSSVELARLHRKALPPSPRDINPRLPREIESVIMKVLSKEPSARYRTADQLARVLQTLLDRIENLDQSIHNSFEISSKPIEETSEETPPETILSFTQEEKSELDRDEEESLNFDWVAIGLSMLATTAVFGLFPFWAWVINQFFK
jgi:eukaryotic-like serine/threonine-protein kinase